MANNSLVSWTCLDQRLTSALWHFAAAFKSCWNCSGVVDGQNPDTSRTKPRQYLVEIENVANGQAEK